MTGLKADVITAITVISFSYVYFFLFLYLLVVISFSSYYIRPVNPLIFLIPFSLFKAKGKAVQFKVELRYGSLSSDIQMWASFIIS